MGFSQSTDCCSIYYAVTEDGKGMDEVTRFSTRTNSAEQMWPIIDGEQEAWLGNYALDPGYIDEVRAFEKGDLDRFDLETKYDETLYWLSNPAQFSVLRRLTQAEQGNGYIYSPRVEGNTLFADSFDLGVGTLERRAFIEVDLSTGKVTEKDESGAVIREFNL